MNLVLLFENDFVSDDVALLRGRRAEHIARVHRAAEGDALVVGVANGRIGSGTITKMTNDVVEMRVSLDREPPAPLPLTLILALPRPKVLNRVIASATSLGVKEISPHQRLARREELLEVAEADGGEPARTVRRSDWSRRATRSFPASRSTASSGSSSRASPRRRRNSSPIRTPRRSAPAT